MQAGYTPLHVAAGYGHAHVVALLLATPVANPLAKTGVRGAQRRLSSPPNFTTPLSSPLVQDGMTPLEVAQTSGKVAAAALLGADPRVAAALAAACKT